MISVRQVDEDGILAGFSLGGWRLHKTDLLLVRGPNVHPLYTLYVTLRESDLFLVDILVSYLWHGCLRHLNKTDITHLSKAEFIPKLSFLDH